jgi:hypothetical protein
MSNYEQLKTVYETSVFKNILHLIDGVYVPLSQKWKNIKVSKLEDYSCLQFNDNVFNLGAGNLIDVFLNTKKTTLPPRA